MIRRRPQEQSQEWLCHTAEVEKVGEWGWNFVRELGGSYREAD